MKVLQHYHRGQNVTLRVFHPTTQNTFCHVTLASNDAAGVSIRAVEQCDGSSDAEALRTRSSLQVTRKGASLGLGVRELILFSIKKC